MEGVQVHSLFYVSRIDFVFVTSVVQKLPFSVVP